MGVSKAKNFDFEHCALDSLLADIKVQEIRKKRKKLVSHAL